MKCHAWLYHSGVWKRVTAVGLDPHHVSDEQGLIRLNVSTSGAGSMNSGALFTFLLQSLLSRQFINYGVFRVGLLPRSTETDPSI